MATLTYFAIRGLVEPVRILLHDNNIKYNEDLVTHDTWKEVKETGVADGSLPMGQLPRFTFADGKSLVQSGAIMRHFGRQLDIYGENDWEKGLVDQYFDCVVDWKRDYQALIYADSLSDAKLAEFQTNEKPAFIAKILAKSKSGYLVGNKISIADYLLFEFVDIVLRIHPKLFESAPQLEKHYQLIKSRPNIKKYLDSNPSHREIINGNRLG